MHHIDAYRMIRRRAAEAGFKVMLGCHVPRNRHHRLFQVPGLVRRRRRSHPTSIAYNNPMAVR
jgi:hypothetical protein